MNQAQIMEKLKEAIGTRGRESAGIQVEFKRAIWQGEDGRTDGFEVVLDALFTHAIQECPQALPYLFPVFALLCGERDSETVVAPVDWSVFTDFLQWQKGEHMVEFVGLVHTIIEDKKKGAMTK